MQISFQATPSPIEPSTRALTAVCPGDKMSVGWGTMTFKREVFASVRLLIANYGFCVCEPMFSYYYRILLRNSRETRFLPLNLEIMRQGYRKRHHRGSL
jgi:hypothetical protein